MGGRGGGGVASYHVHLKKPAICMRIVSTAEISNKAAIKCIQSENNNKTGSKFQVDQTEGLEQNGIKRTGIKHVQK